MNIVDFVLIVFILLVAYAGFRDGFIRTVVGALGLILVFVLSFYLKNPLAEWLSLNLPFFNFWGSFREVTILNVVIYQAIAFFIVFAILIAIYSIVIKITNVIERILKFTIILGIPSKILGFIAGLIEGYFLTGVILVLFSLPILNFDLVRESKVRNFMFEKTPIMGSMLNDTTMAYDEIMDLREEFSSNSKKEEFNKKSFEILLKYKIMNTDYAEKLVSSGKLKIDGATSIINKYKEN